MVDVMKLKSRMALAGYSQKALVAALNARGLKISENTLSAKMKGRSQFYVEDAVTICEILGIESSSDKADIFLA